MPRGPCASDFLGALTDRDEHYVHDSDPADQQGDSTDCGEHQGQSTGDGPNDAERILLGPHCEVVIPKDVVSLTQQVRDLEFGGPCTAGVPRFHADETQTDPIGGIPTGESGHHGR